MSRLIRNLAFVSSVLLIAGCSTMGGSGNARNTATKQVELANKAQNVLQHQMSHADEKRIPSQLIADARCIAVFPSVIKAGLIIGGQHGQGLVSCRQNSGSFKTANPAVFSLSSGSIGLQVGAQKSSLILLFTTRQSVNALLRSKINLGSQIAATAGPSGYNRLISHAPAPVVAYAMSRNGLYAGIDLSGTKMSFNWSANTSLYGLSATPRGILLGNAQPANAINSYRQTLQQFAPASNTNTNTNTGTGNNSQSTQQSNANQPQTNGNQQSAGQQSGTNQSQSNSNQ